MNFTLFFTVLLFCELNFLFVSCNVHSLIQTMYYKQPEQHSESLYIEYAWVECMRKILIENPHAKISRENIKMNFNSVMHNYFSLLFQWRMENVFVFYFSLAAHTYTYYYTIPSHTHTHNFNKFGFGYLVVSVLVVVFRIFFHSNIVRTPYTCTRTRYTFNLLI